jgi:diguanylate cyclase (GGDEF)-like protein
VKAKILLIEDSEQQAGRIKDSLEKLGYEALWARSGFQGLRLAREETPDLVLLDVVMADMDGFAVCRWLKVGPETRDIPVIMLTVKGEVRDKVDGLNVGANDYLPKPFEDEELEARILAALRSRIKHTELQQRNAELESMLHHVEGLAITDPLTGLFNRRRFSDVLRREFAVTQRYKNNLSCMMVDLDHFKQINDRFGHDAGDEVLKQTARKLGETLREVDLAARYGGEEFVILLPHTDKVHAAVVAERISDLIRAQRFEFGGESLAVTASFGIADTSDAVEGKSEDLVRAADLALYRAKESGRDRVAVYQAGELRNQDTGRRSSPP